MKTLPKTLHMPLLLCIAGLLSASQAARADEAEMDIDSKFRAKIVKEKAKLAVTENQKDKNGKNGKDDAECGSQSIGNVQTNGRPGTAPREVFVFAPNAINLVSARGCN